MDDIRCGPRPDPEGKAAQYMFPGLSRLVRTTMLAEDDNEEFNGKDG